MELICIIKRELVISQIIIGLSDPLEDNENRNLVIDKVTSLISVLKTMHVKRNEECIKKREQDLEMNNSLQDIFSLLWNMLEENIEEGYLSKEGYKRLSHKMNIVLFGVECNIKENISIFKAIVETNWNIDIQRFGLINKGVFFDILFEYFDIWSELIHVNLHSVFLWVLLDGVADTTRHPPQLRPNKQLCCIVDIPYGTLLLGKYKLHSHTLIC